MGGHSSDSESGDEGGGGVKVVPPPAKAEEYRDAGGSSDGDSGNLDVADLDASAAGGVRGGGRGGEGGGEEGAPAPGEQTGDGQEDDAEDEHEVGYERGGEVYAKGREAELRVGASEENSRRSSVANAASDSPLVAQEIVVAAASEPLTEEDVGKHRAALALQRVMRGHMARKTAAYTPLWCAYPLPKGTTGWSYALPSGSRGHVQDMLHRQEYTDRLELLGKVLEDGLLVIPGTTEPTTAKPFDTGRTRSEVLKDLIVWCCETAIRYLEERFPQPVIFLLTSVDSLCLLCESQAGLKAQAQFKGCGSLHIWALDALAHLRFMASELHEGLELLDRALELYEMTGGAVGRLPYVLVQMHRACCFTQLSQHENSLRTLEGILPALPSVARLPMGQATLVNAAEVAAHALVIAVHNTAVSLSFLGRHDEARNARARSLSLSSSVMVWQPVLRVLNHGYAACLRPSAAPEVEYVPRPMTVKFDTKEASLHTTAGDASVRGDAVTSAPSWRRWLTVVSEGDALAPIWVPCPPPPAEGTARVMLEQGYTDKGTGVELELLEEAEQLAREAERLAKRNNTVDSSVMGLSAIQGPEGEGAAGELSFIAELEEIAGMDVTRAEQEAARDPVTASEVVAKDASLAAVEGEMRRMCELARETESVQIAGEVLRLLSPAVYSCCGEIGWGMQVVALSTMAEVLYRGQRDWRGAAGYAEQALFVASEHKDLGKMQAAFCRLQCAACVFRLGQYAKAFSLAKESLKYTQQVTKDESQDEVVRRALEDVVTAGCHVMALAHLFLGTALTALTLSRTATEHIRGSSFADKAGEDFQRVYKAHQIAMSMKELTTVRSSLAKLTAKPATSSGGSSPWSDSRRSRLDPNLFVPGALANNLPKGQSRFRTTWGGASAAARGEAPEGVVAAALEGDEEAAASGGGSPVRYNWSGRFQEWEARAGPMPGTVAAGEYEPVVNVVTLQQLRDGIPRSPLTTGLFRGGNAERMQAASDSRRRRVVGMVGMHKARSASVEPERTRDLTWVGGGDGKEAVQSPTERLGASPFGGSRMYFAQTVGRGGKAALVSPMGGRISAVMKDWGPDPTTDLLSMSKGVVAKIRGTLAADAKPGGKVRMSRAAAGPEKEEGEEAKQVSPLKLANVRVGKHLPFDHATQGSMLALFGSRSTREGLVRQLEERTGMPVRELDWSNELPNLHAKAMTRHEARKELEANDQSQARRPFYWSHPPEPSVYVGGGKRSFAKSNRNYAAMPYGVELGPAAKLAYGAAPKTPLLGIRSAGSTRVDRQRMVESAELTRKSDYIGGFKASRSMTSFY